MTQYLLSIYRDDTPLTEEDFERSYRDVNALADELNALGGLVFAGGLNHATRSVVRSVDGKVVITDGPFSETKEQLGGFWIITVGDVDTAREYAAKLAAACQRPIELSTFEEDDASVEELYEHMPTP